MRRILTWLVLGGAGALVVIQLVPYGRDHTSPPVTQAAVFKSPKAQSDVDEGRTIMNLSEWNKPQPPLDEVVELIDSGEMPPLKYKIMPNHSDARLSDVDKQDLIAGFRQVYADQPPAIRQGGGD